MAEHIAKPGGVNQMETDQGFVMTDLTFTFPELQTHMALMGIYEAPLLTLVATLAHPTPSQFEKTNGRYPVPNDTSDTAAVVELAKAYQAPIRVRVGVRV